MKIFNKIALLFGAAVIIAGCTKHDELNQPGNGSGSGNSVAITANASTSSNPDTKLGYNEGVDAMSFTWEDNGSTKESFSVLVQDGDGTPYKFEQTDEGGNRIGAFSGTVVAENGKKLYAVYPELAAGTYNPTAVKLDLSKQKLVSTAADLKHNKYHYMLSEATYNGSSDVDFSFTHKVSILKVELEFPAGTATEITELRLSGLNTDANLDATTGVLDFTGLTASTSTLKSDTGIALSSDKLTAYIYVFPQDLTGKDLTLYAVGANGKSYTVTFSGSNIGEGNVYTLSKTLTEVVVMSFTIDTHKNYFDKTFIVPFAGTLTGYSLAIDWGDGTNNSFADGSTLDQANMTHTYPAVGEYTITIKSSEADYSKQQIPSFNFGNYQISNNSKKLISINTPLLNMNLEDMTDTFYGCSNLTTIHELLFANNTEVTTFATCLSYCEGLIEIPEGLFDKNTKATDFSSCFSGCLALTKIPELLFTNRTEVTTFKQCFENCPGLTEIPAGLFDKNTKVTDFSNCFSRCSGLTKIPELLFANNTEVTTLSGCFSACSGLTKIPAGLFDKNTKVTNLNSCFSGSGLTEIPAGLFDNNTEVTNLSSCFFGCSDLTEIPELLFANNTEVTTFDNCFSGSGLTEIPAGLFDKNTKVTDLSSCFFECYDLTKIPELLFAKNTEVTNFNCCFSLCTKVKLNSNIFCDETTEMSTRFAGKTMDFGFCFNDCGSDVSIAVGDGGTAPALWDYPMAASTSEGCFFGVTKVNNVGDIDPAWTDL